MNRRHDLDALRAFAMLLGLALHAAMSFVPGAPWAVQDTQQSDGFVIFVAAVHGFRMQLFFLVSGFFTAMLWRGRGLRAVVTQRLKRVLLPCLLGLVTILPLGHWVSEKATQPVKRPALTRTFSEGADPNGRDPEFGVTLLAWAAMQGDLAMAQRLLEKGADVNAKNGDGSTPLHGAAFLGNDTLVALLLSKGANPQGKNNAGQPPAESTRADAGTTQYLIGLLRLPPRPQSAIDEGRKRCQAQLPALPSAPLGVRTAYGAFINTSGFTTPVFDHLWFLWFLCWLLPCFALWTRLKGGVSWRPLWLLPLPLIPQFFMGTAGPSFGPDTNVGWLPPPHLVLYYGIFFFFGALYFENGGTSGKSWRWQLPVALLIVFPLGLITMGAAPAFSGAVQVLYTWLMIFGLLGLFGHLITRENKTLRYLSDASYWLYLSHIPLVIALQSLVRSWPLLPGLKFLVVFTLVTAALLTIYQTLVRYTVLGTLLNGRRQKNTT